MSILVLTADLDPTADLVINELLERDVSLVRFDPSDFPGKSSMSVITDTEGETWAGLVRGQHRDVVLADVRSVYYRRPSSETRLPPSVAEADAAWARAEAVAGLGGVIASLDCLWVNHPSNNNQAMNKPRALTTAAQSGLVVPRTLITNEPEQARSFIRRLPGQVAAYKPLGYTWPPNQGDEAQALWTNRVTADDITSGVGLTAHQFQEWIEKACEVRVTVVGDQLFAAEIHAGSDASRIDFRSDYDSLSYKPCAVPESVEFGVRTLLSRFGLRYAALDFLVDQQGRWYFVDLNPNGQWAFVPDLREPIARALADLLQGVAE